jgi:hypothetical protein
MARFIFGQHIECHLLRIKQVKRIGAPQFTFMVYAPGHDVLFCQPAVNAVSVSISVLFYTVGLKINTSMVTMTPWFLYLIRTADNALYTGITTDVQRRYKQHQRGKARRRYAERGTHVGICGASWRPFAGPAHGVSHQTAHEAPERAPRAGDGFEALAACSLIKSD